MKLVIGAQLGCQLRKFTEFPRTEGVPTRAWISELAKTAAILRHLKLLQRWVYRST